MEGVLDVAPQSTKQYESLEAPLAAPSSGRAALPPVRLK
jgi:hypothetical protein